MNIVPDSFTIHMLLAIGIFTNFLTMMVSFSERHFGYFYVYVANMIICGLLWMLVYPLFYGG